MLVIPIRLYEPILIHSILSYTAYTPHCLTLSVLEYTGIPLPEMPFFPSSCQRNREGTSASMDGGVISATNSVTSGCINHVPPTSTLTDHHHHHHDHDHRPSPGGGGGSIRLNKFVRRLHDMLIAEKDSGVVEWRRGLLVLYSTDAFSKRILPKYFNTRNFKTFRRQLNYYGFVHVRSFSATGNTTTALWINQELARDDANNDVRAVLKLRRVEPCETAKTVEGRRQRKELALHTVEEDIGLNSKKLQLDQIRFMAIRGEEYCTTTDDIVDPHSRHPQQQQQQTMLLLPQTMVTSAGCSNDYHPQQQQQQSMSCLMEQPPSPFASTTHNNVGIPREVHIPTDSEESNQHSDSCCCEEDESCSSPIPPPTYAALLGGQDEAMLLQNVNTAAANMLLMLARS
jgi:hypothetical protein